MMVINKIAAVSYLNTVPFIYGITHADNLRAQLVLSPPSGCAGAFHSKQTDIALIPVGALDDNPDAQIITSFCIGAEKSVRTVVIVSDSPIEKVKRLWMDSHSLTSVTLARILCAEYWKIKPETAAMNDYSLLADPKEGDAFLLIGDKVFGHEGRFAYSYDLADIWRQHTGLPFVFAVWVGRKGTVSEEGVDALEDALTLGVERIYEAIIENGHGDKDYAYEYLTRNIDFLFDAPKRRALELFLAKSKKVNPHAHPG